MKRAISACLVLATLLATASPALALGQNESNLEGGAIAVEYVGHGEYRLSNSTKRSSVLDTIEHAEIGDVFCVPTAIDEDIIQLTAEKYLMKASEESYFLADKKVVDIDNPSANEKLFADNNISADAQERIEEAISAQKAMGNEEFSIEVFVPSKIEQSDTRANPSISHSTYTYYDKIGSKWFIKDTSIKYAGVWSPQVEKKGTKAKDMAEAFVNLGISAVGTVSKKVSVFGVATSLYGVYVAARGPVVSGSGTDQTHSWLYYDRIEKESYTSASGWDPWYIGKTSHKVWINKLVTRQLYTGNATPFDKDFPVNQEHYTQHWNNTQMTVDRWQWEDYIKTLQYDTTVILNSKG